MARIKLTFPDNFAFQTRTVVRVGDVNYGGHLGNDAVLSLVHEARIRYLKSLGYTEIDMEGCGLIMADSAVVYKSEAFIGDGILIDVVATDFGKLGFDLMYKLSNKETNKEIAQVKTGMVCFDYDTRKVCALPQAAYDKLNQEK